MQDHLLTDDQMKQFITKGYVLLKTDFSDEFHRKFIEQLDYVYEKEGNPGNNLLPRILEVQQVFEHPVITGALTSVLGEGYMMHAHRHGHHNNVPKHGGWHKDSYWGYHRTRNIHPWWAMIMYFPQDTPLELGPTAVIPGTQYYESRTFENDEHETEVRASGEKGTFILIHYDIWHRSTANLIGNHRYMLKFEFMRTQSPTGPRWNNMEREWSLPQAADLPEFSHQVMWQETWNWLSGKLGSITEASTSHADAANAPALIAQLKHADPTQRVVASDRLGLLGTSAIQAGALPALAAALEDSFEPVQLNAAYGLARMGDVGIPYLLSALHHETMSISRAAAYGLSVSTTQPARDGLIAALASDHERTVIHAAFALGELREFASSAVPAINALANHPSEHVRHTAVEALSSIGIPNQEVVSGLTQGLKDENQQVRFTAGLCMSKLGSAAREAVPALIGSLTDENRYVRAHAAEALYYIGTEQAKDALIEYLRPSRWCQTTTAENTFYP